MAGRSYLIVGGGMTADSACRGIREHDPDGSVVVVGAEPDPPYDRPPLTKGLWAGKAEDSIWRSTEGLGVELRLGTRIASVHPGSHTAVDDRGETYEYDRVLLATGGRPRRLPLGGDDEVVYFRTLADYRRVRALADTGSRFVVVGGGFIGSELAAALASNGCAVALVFPEDWVCARVFPPELAAFVTGYYRERGVEVHAGRTVEAVEGGAVRLDDGTELGADAIAAGLGIEPAVELAAQAGLEVADGIVVDDRGRAAGAEDVFAAGDVARFPLAGLGDARVEHEDHANTHGRTVGANMAGADVPYDHLPFFYSDLFDLGYEAVGEVSSRLATVAHWLEPNRSGVIAYVDGGSRPRGFLLWNVWDKVAPARELIRAGAPVDTAALEGLAG